MQLLKKYIENKNIINTKHTNNFDINEQISSPLIRLINEKGIQIGIFSKADAINKAKINGLDLVEVSSTSNPPVCKLMNYGKFKYQQKRKTLKIKKNQSILNTKEIKFRPKTDTHDLQFKIKRIKKFLLQKKKVKISIVFKGREIIHTQIGQKMLNNILLEIKELSTIESTPKMDGKQLIIILLPSL